MFEGKHVRLQRGRRYGGKIQKSRLGVVRDEFAVLKFHMQFENSGREEFSIFERGLEACGKVTTLSPMCVFMSGRMQWSVMPILGTGGGDDGGEYWTKTFVFGQRKWCVPSSYWGHCRRLTQGSVDGRAPGLVSDVLPAYPSGLGRFDGGLPRRYVQPGFSGEKRRCK